MTWQVGDTIEEDVIIYDGYDEEASRLVFHYSDHFANLEGSIEQRTFLPSGVSENEPKKLPIKPEDEAPDKVCVTSPGPLCHLPVPVEVRSLATRATEMYAMFDLSRAARRPRARRI